MFLSAPSIRFDGVGFPRARGDVPGASGLMGVLGGFSPRTRGCSYSRTYVRSSCSVFPAHAGMFLTTGCAFTSVERFPRARGDVPPLHLESHTPPRFSPRTRGCSGQGVSGVEVCYVFPAHAGMFRRSSTVQTMRWCFPRARGDVPGTHPLIRLRAMFSPRTRGCSCPMTSRYPASHVFPAHAGMFLQINTIRRIPQRFPRARGDVPLIFDSVLPTSPFSPRTRGCSGDSYVEHRHHPVFPAHAGMFLFSRGAGSTFGCFPRARGDVPQQR